MKKSAHSLPFIQPHLVGDHRNELRVRWFSPQVMDGVAEVAVEGIHIAPVPSHLDGVADGALHPAGGGAVFLGDFRVEALGHGVDILRLVHGEQDGIPQELVALDMGRDGIRVGRRAINLSQNLIICWYSLEQFIVTPVYRISAAKAMFFTYCIGAVCPGGVLLQSLKSKYTAPPWHYLQFNKRIIHQTEKPVSCVYLRSDRLSYHNDLVVGIDNRFISYSVLCHFN